jgi:LmbE family N-acetylglucosaminyl deacetylase
MLSSSPLKLLAILAHPDDESLGFGGTLAKYAAEGVSTHLVCATRGEKGWMGSPEEDPGPRALGVTRTAELLDAARELGLRTVDFLGYTDGELAQADPLQAVAQIARLVRQIRPQVVVTFDPQGNYGHPDHIAISQFASAALVSAAGYESGAQGLPPHRVDKFYYMVNNPRLIPLLRAQLGEEITMEVDGVVRSSIAWPDWSITTRLELRDYWQPVRRAILCHTSQLPSLGNVPNAPDEVWCELISEINSYYRSYSLVPVKPGPETDLFAGIR